MTVSDPEQLQDEVAALVCDLPRVVVSEVVDRIERAPNLEGDSRSSVLAAVHNESNRRRLAWLLDAWSAQSAAPPAALAWALRAAQAVDAKHRARQRLELVWTGPAPHGTTLRRTDQVLLDLLRGARRRIVLVTFAAYRVSAFREALVQAADRGVDIDFVFESPEESLGKMTSDPRHALGSDLAKRCSLWVWPDEERERDQSGRSGKLHAKCALIDGEKMFVSSANFTGDAMYLNMEMGVLIDGGDLPKSVASHLEGLMRAGTLALLV